MIQKLESDVRGHFKLEHEMKIHMDYLEGKIEAFAAQQDQAADLNESLQKRLETAQDKLKMVKEQRDREARDAGKKLQDAQGKIKLMDARIQELER